MGAVLSSEARGRLDAHLDAVEKALVKAGRPRQERWGVVDDLEAQILDMLQARSQTPTVEDVEAVLGELDPPAAYEESGSTSTATSAAATPTPPPASPRYSRTAIWGFVCILLSFLVPAAVFIPLFFVSFGMHKASSLGTDRPPGPPEIVRLAPVTVKPNKVSPSSELPPPPPVRMATLTDITLALEQKELHLLEIVEESGSEFIVTGTYMPKLRNHSGQMIARVPASALDDATLAALSNKGRELGTAVAIRRVPHPVAHSNDLTPVVLGVMAPFSLAATLLGWIAFFQIRGSDGALRGTGLALFDGLFWPCVLALVLLPMVA